ncbi:S-layer homology domain-containing protein [Lysinibacillus odysseyi]|uniref:S-layer homology domain-containing protein n=1 Tax=Lysinibacillus odysseyi TaxID=202611 RepID=UPI0006918658|nr:S-layer homology domain-containing protein [Lysinibacillus odysseyi]
MVKNTAHYEKVFKTAMATAMAASAIAVVAPESTKASISEGDFTDVKASSDYYEYVNELFERGFVSGYKDGSFKPTGLLTRAQASKILALNLGLDVNKTFNHTFTDVPKSDWAYPYIAALKEAGIIDGYQDGTFKPGSPITRNQMAKILVNGYGLEPATDITLPFTDAQKDNWAAPYIQTLFDLGITIGQTATTYGGNSTVTRANMAAFAIRSEIKTDYRENRRPDENVISSINDNTITLDGKVYYIKKELQPLLHKRNLDVLNEANLDFIKIGTKIVGIRNLELLNDGTADKQLTLDLAGGTVDANITIAGDYIKIVNANITGDITIKKGNQKDIELSGLDLNGRLIVEGEAKRDQESAIKLTDTNVDEIVVNRDKTKIITNHATPAIKVGSNVSGIEIDGKINSIDFIGNQDVLVRGVLETNELTIETPIKVTLENKAHLPVVETQQYGSQLIVPNDSTIGTLIKPNNIKKEEAVKFPNGGQPSIGNIKDTSDVDRPTVPPTTPPSTGGGSTGGGNSGGITNPFVSQTLTANNTEDADHKDPLAVGMIGTTVTSSNLNVATATITDGKISITSKGPGTAIISIKEAAPSLKEAQIIVTVDAYGKMKHTIKRPVEVAQEKITATPAPDAADLVKLFEGIDIKGITPENVTDVTAAVKKAITDKGTPLTGEELKLVVDTALLPTLIKNDNPSLEQVSTPLDLVTAGPNGTSFEWKSVTKVGDHNASIDLSTGNVTQDDADDENDKFMLNVTATNGTSIKAKTIETTILESRNPYLVSAVLNDLDGDGDTSANDTITFTFSEPIVYTGNPEDIAEQYFGNPNAFGNEPIEVIWSEDKTKLTVKIGGGDLSNAFKLDSDITLIANAVKDSNGVTNEAKTIKLQQALYDYEIIQNNLTGDFIWQNNTVISEAAGKIKDSITFSRNGKQVEDVDISYTAEDILIDSGSIESGTFKLKSVNVMKNGKTEKVTFKNGETLNVTTLSVLRVKNTNEFINSVNNQYVVDKRVKTVKVDSTITTPIELTSYIDIKYPVSIDGQNQLVLQGVQISANDEKVKLEKLRVEGAYTNSSYRSSVLVWGNAKVELDEVEINQINTGGYSYAGVLLRNDNAELDVNNSKILATLVRSGSNGQHGSGIRADGANVMINIKNSTVSGKTKKQILNNGNLDYGYNAFGIQTKENAIVNIENSTVTAGAEEEVVNTIKSYGIYLGQGSSLTMTGTNKIHVIGPNSNAYGIGNNDKYNKLDVSTDFEADREAYPETIKELYEYDINTVVALNSAWSKIDENLIKANNPSIQEVTESLNLPVEVGGVSVSWAADTVDGATVNTNGTVTRSSNDDEDDVVTLTATLTHNGMTKTKEFQVAIKENKVPEIASATLIDGNADGKATMGESVELAFSEPVTFGQLFIGDQEISTEMGFWSEDKKKLTVTLQDDITAADTINVKVNKLKDAANNSIVERTVELTVPSATEAFKISNVNITQNGAEPVTITQQGIYKFSVDINLTTDGEGFTVGGVDVAKVSGQVIKKIETEKYDVTLELGGNPYTVVTATEKIASGENPKLTTYIRYPGNTYKAEVIQPSLIPSPGSEQIASFTVSDAIQLAGENTRNQTVAITIGEEEVEKEITLSSETTNSTLAAAIATAFADVFSDYTITAENNKVIIAANTKARNLTISARLK